MGFLKFLIIAICILYIIRVLARIFLPFLFKKAVNKMQEKMYQQQNEQQQNSQNNTKKEGSIHVDFIPPKSPKKPKLDTAGDFVDYVELKKE